MEESVRASAVARRVAEALDRRDVEAVVSALSPDAVVTVGGTHLRGRPAVQAWLDDVLGRTSASRWQVEESTAVGRLVTDRVVLGALPAGDGREWVVATGVTAWSVGDDDLLGRVDVSVDAAALRAQWAATGGSAALTAGSIRSDLARAAFDADAGSRTVVRVVGAPPAPRRRRRRAALAGGLAAVVVLAAALLAGDRLLPSGSLPSQDTAVGAPVAELASPTAGSTSLSPSPSTPPSTSTSIEAGPSPSAAAPVVPGTPDDAAEPTTGSEPVLGPEATEEEDGTERLVLSETVLFPSGSSQLRPEAVQVLESVVADLERAGRGTVRVVGHTDSRGTVPSNDALSLARAEAVAEVLGDGLAGTALTVVAEGRGQREPAASNDTEEGRAANRRVDLEYTDR